MWINRTTFKFQSSRDPAIADQVNWLKLHYHPGYITGSFDPQDWEVVGEEVEIKNEASRVIRIRKLRIAQVNARTAVLIEQGFSYGGEVFSLSLTAQANLQDLYARRTSISWPLTIEVGDDSKTLVLADQAAGGAYYLSARNTIDGHRLTGRALKDQLRTATTLAELEAVVDSR